MDYYIHGRKTGLLFDVAQYIRGQQTSDRREHIAWAVKSMFDMVDVNAHHSSIEKALVTKL